MMGLGKSTLRVLAAIREDPRASLRELMAACGMASPSVVHYHLLKLVEAKLITREPGARGIYVGERRRGNKNGKYTYHKSKDEISRIRKEAARKRKSVDQGVRCRKSRMRERGEGGLPRLSKERQAELIDQVVRKARESEGRGAWGRDVVRSLRMRGARLTTLKASKVG